MSVPWSSISASEALARWLKGACAVDVRSSQEFSRGAIPRAKLIPILNDEHRHQVGWTYKHRGGAAAEALGFELVGPFKTDLVKAWRTHLEAVPSEQRLIFCWRGGQRSAIASQWLAEAGVEGLRIHGGYKALRRELVSTFARPLTFLVLSGLTGSGKTTLLRTFQPETILDLEALAEHRGSVFGSHGLNPQPAQATFENRLGFGLWQGSEELLVEDESSSIGHCRVPDSIFRQLSTAPVVQLEIPLVERVQNIFTEYVETPVQHSGRDLVLQGLLGSVQRLERRLGGLRAGQIRQALISAFAQAEMDLEHHVAWIETLLREYYDPSYEYAVQRQKRTLLFRGDYGAVLAFVKDRIAARASGWRP